MVQPLFFSGLSHLFGAVHSNQMHYHSLTASCFFLVTQAAPLSVRNSIIFGNSDYSTEVHGLEQSISHGLYLPLSTENQPSPLNPPTEHQTPSTKNSLSSLIWPSEHEFFPLTLSTENRPQNLNAVPLHIHEDTVPANSILRPSTSEADRRVSIYGNQLAAAAPSYTSKGCDRPNTFQLCDSNNQNPCRRAKIATDSNNRQNGKICPRDSTIQHECITYTLYVPKGSCGNDRDFYNCRLCDPNDPNNEQTCAPAITLSYTSTTVFICPQNGDPKINCVRVSI